MSSGLIIDGIEVRNTADLCAIYEARYAQYGASPKALLYTHNPDNHAVKIQRYSEIISVLLRGSQLQVLDIGCGYGSLAPYIPPELYTGIDVVEAFVRKAQADHPTHKFRQSALEDYRDPADLMVMVGVTGSVPKPFDLVEQAWQLAQFGLLVDFNERVKFAPGSTNPDTKLFSSDEVEFELVKRLGSNFQRFPGSYYTMYLFCK